MRAPVFVNEEVHESHSLEGAQNKPIPSHAISLISAEDRPTAGSCYKHAFMGPVGRVLSKSSAPLGV